jgi:hypothetical protein
METRIWVSGGWRNISPSETVNSTRRLQSFCVFNCLECNIFKSQGGYYKLSDQGRLEFVTRTLGTISFQDVYSLLSKY